MYNICIYDDEKNINHKISWQFYIKCPIHTSQKHFSYLLEHLDAAAEGGVVDGRVAPLSPGVEPGPGVQQQLRSRQATA